MNLGFTLENKIENIVMKYLKMKETYGGQHFQKDFIIMLNIISPDSKCKKPD